MFFGIVLWPFKEKFLEVNTPLSVGIVYELIS